MSLSAILGGLGGSQGTGGGASSAESVGSGWSNSVSDSWSRTYGSEATAKSYEEAIRATQRQEALMDKAMRYNTQEAYAQRAFNEMMGNSIYTRSIKNMIEAGINPILAANMGLSGASVQSGAAASISTPSAFMGQTFADQASASHSESASGWNSESHSQGSNWNNSESGLATGLAQLGNAIGSGLNALSSAKFFEVNVGDSAKEAGKKIVEDVGNSVRDGVEKAYDAVTSPTVNPDGYGYKSYNSRSKLNQTDSTGGGRKFTTENNKIKYYRNKVQELKNR